MGNRFLVILSMFLVLASTGAAQLNQNPNNAFTYQDAVTLVNQLLTAVTPENPENAYMTPIMREKIRWIYDAKASHRLKLLLVDNSNGGMGSRLAFMASGYVDGVPYIEISANRLLELIRLQQHVMVGFNQMQKNGFALALVHEGVHLEKPQSFFTNPRSKEESDREELRAYRKVDELAVTHLIELGQPLDVDYYEMHEIFKKCPGLQDCPAFQKYYAKKTMRPQQK